MDPPKIETDFNGFIERNLLCLAHCVAPLDHTGHRVELFPGRYVIAFSPDEDEDGNPEFLIASGVVEPSPRELTHLGSVWSLRVDERGVRYLTSLEEAD